MIIPIPLSDALIGSKDPGMKSSIGPPISAVGCFWDHVPTHERSRFNLLLLEFGEIYFGDYQVTRYRTKGRTRVRVNGRLKVSSRSLVFEPAGDVSQPLLRFPYKQITSLMKYTPRPHETQDFENPSCLFIFTCSMVTEMKSNDVVAPYVTKKAGVEDCEGPEFIIGLVHTALSDFLALVERLMMISGQVSRMGGTWHLEESLLKPLLDERLQETLRFDTIHLVSFREKLLLSAPVIVDRITPLLKNPGCLMVTDERIYFQPAELNNVDESIISFPLSNISQLYRRRYMLRQTGFEVFFSEGYEGGRITSVFFAFRSSKDRDMVYNLLMKQPELLRLKERTIEEVTRQWQKRDISNFEYIAYLNTVADRSMNDITQYPVFPWVIADYTSKSLKLDDPETFRDLSKPIGAINPERLGVLKQRYSTMPDEDKETGIPPRFLYGTHYSTPAYVLFYLVRAAPEYMLCLQNGKFDAADRMFFSIADTWRSCLQNPADLKELIPEFYCSNGQFLKNIDDIPLGITQNGARVQDVLLPPWAKSERDFVKKCRKAIESDHVSQHLHEWIDLIFGYKQQGEEAVKADNVFYYLTYEGAVDLEKVSNPVERAAIEAQISEFGQTPKQIFAGPHPSRNDLLTPVQLTSDSAYSTSPSSKQSSLAFTFSADAFVPGMETRRFDQIDLSAASSTFSAPQTPGLHQSPLGQPTLNDGFLASTQDIRSEAQTKYRDSLMFRGGLASPLSPSASQYLGEDPEKFLELWLTKSQQDPYATTAGLSKERDAGGEEEGNLPTIVRLEDLGLDELSPFNGTKSDVMRTSLLTAREYRHGFGDVYKGEKPSLIGSASLSLHREKVTCLKLTDQGATLCSTSQDGTFRVSGVESKIEEDTASNLPTVKANLRSKRHFIPSDVALSCCALTPDNKIAVMGSWNNNVYLYSISSACQMYKLAAHEDGISTLDLQGSIFCTGAWDATVKAWQMTPTGVMEDPLLELFDHDKPIQSLAMDQTGNLVAASAEDGSILIWDLRSGNCVSSIQGSRGHQAVSGVKWAGDRQIFACSIDGALQAFTLEGKCIGSTQINSDLRCINVRKDGGFVVAGCGDASLRVWSNTGGLFNQCFVQTGAHEEGICAVEVDWDKSLVVTGSSDSTIKVWHAVIP